MTPKIKEILEMDIAFLSTAFLKTDDGKWEKMEMKKYLKIMKEWSVKILCLCSLFLTQQEIQDWCSKIFVWLPISHACRIFSLEVIKFNRWKG